MQLSRRATDRSGSLQSHPYQLSCSAMLDAAAAGVLALKTGSSFIHDYYAVYTDDRWAVRSVCISDYIKWRPDRCRQMRGTGLVDSGDGGSPVRSSRSPV